MSNPPEAFPQPLPEQEQPTFELGEAVTFVENRFFPLLQRMAAFYDRPKMATDADIAFRTTSKGLERHSALRGPDRDEGTFIFDVEDFTSFYQEFSSYMNPNGVEDEQQLLDAAAKLFIGIGIGTHLAQRDISDPRVPSTKQRLKAVREVFTSKDDIAELFMSLTDDNNLSFMSRHIHDSAIMKINGLRVGMRYLYDAVPEATDPYDLIRLQEIARANLQELIRSEANFYVDLSVFSFGQAPEQGEKTFAYWLPDWLVAIATNPIRRESLQHLNSEAWKK
jgi:hypothetical protein